MAVSRDPGRTAPRQPLRTLLENMSRYDLLLAVLPLGFLLSALVYLLAPIPFRVALAGGALFGLVVTVDALFVHPPAEKPPRSGQ